MKKKIKHSPWIIVSNRLPLQPDAKGERLIAGEGGLVTAITGIKSKTPLYWVGSVSGEKKKLAGLFNRDSSLKDTHYHPIFLNEKLYDSYYNGFCNDTLWPLLHYETSLIKVKDDCWQNYKRVNQLFANEIYDLNRKLALKNPVIWIHDFHFFLLPKMLKDLDSSLTIGHFLHIPFPSSEIFRQLPYKQELLEGVLASDLIGFHDFSYLGHFVSSAKIALGAKSDMLSIDYHGHKTKIGVFPASIDTKAFKRRAASEKTKIKRDELKKLRPKYLVLGVDRLDYIKGIDLKIKIFHKFLEKFPEFQKKVQLIQVAVPSRTGVAEYILLKQEIDQLISEVNGKFSTPGHTPINYLFKSVNKYELAALYREADALLVTSKRDGLNLVALEYIVSQEDKKPGVLILSEFAGAMSNLSHAMSINPWDLEASADALGRALSMPLAERRERHEAMQTYLDRYSATKWAESFMKELFSSHESQQTIQIDGSYRPRGKKKGAKRILFLDYDGTLTPIVEGLEKALLPVLEKGVIKKLSDHPNNEVVILSGRDKKFLEKQFSGMHVHLASEHGAITKLKDKQEWRKLEKSKSRRWYSLARTVMADFSEKVPQSFIEEKAFAICWHYRKAPSEFSEYQARKLVLELESILKKEQISVIAGKKVVEVRSLKANKGSYADWFLSKYKKTNQHDGDIIALGDDRTDEDTFIYLNREYPHATTVKVGPGETAANFQLADQHQVVSFLKLFL